MKPDPVRSPPRFPVAAKVGAPLSVKAVCGSEQEAKTSPGKSFSAPQFARYDETLAVFNVRCSQPWILGSGSAGLGADPVD